MTKAAISLTEFMNFSTRKSTNSRMSAVKTIKYKGDYHPAFDYWKQLRDEIKRVLEKELPIETLNNLIYSISEDKVENYKRNINAFISFYKKYSPEYFDVGKAVWTFDENLSVRANPELGLIISGVPHLVKIHYKSTNKDVSKQTVNTTLTAMQLATAEFPLPENPSFSVLNLTNKKLYSTDKLLDDDVTLLTADAFQFSYLWSKV